MLPTLLPSDGDAWTCSDLQAFFSLVYAMPSDPPAVPCTDDDLRHWLRIQALARYFENDVVALQVEQWLVSAWPDALVIQNRIEHAKAYAQSLIAMLAMNDAAVAPQRIDMCIQLVAWSRSALASCDATAATAVAPPDLCYNNEPFLALDELPRMACQSCCAADPVLAAASGRVLLRRRRHSDLITIGMAVSVDYATLDRDMGYAQYSLVPPRPCVTVAMVEETPTTTRDYTGICPHCHARGPLVIHWIRGQ
jgi:hypothetical protein